MVEVDVVNEKDEVIGTVNEEAATFDKSAITRGGAIFLFNRKGELLLQKRSLKKFRYPLHWDSSVGFFVKSGETHIEAAVREAHEELGLRIQKAQLERVARMPITTDKKEMEELFTLRHDGPFAPNEYEVHETRFFPVEAVARMLANPNEKFSPVFRILFEKWTELGRPVSGRIADR